MKIVVQNGSGPNPARACTSIFTAAIDEVGEDLDHLISPDERLPIAMARQ